jgi:GDPmannose 4,6-dehydratase
MIALVTGVTGQTGGYLCEQLIAAGWSVHGLVRDADDLESEFRSRSPEAVLHSGDLSSVADIERVVAAVAPDAIFNLGGLSSVAQSWKEPELTGLIDGLRVGTLLNAAWELRKSVGRPVAFVQASSAEIFGAASEVPQNENTPLRPTNPYGAAKAYAHQLVGVYRGLGLEASSCILYNHESPRRPETFVTRKITRGVARIALGIDDALVLGSLDVSRDWGWAPDYARALALAARGPAGDYVIATGQQHTVRDFVGAAFTAAGITDWHSLVRQDPAFMRPGDAPLQVGDATRAERVLGWRPEVTFSEIVTTMVENDLALARAELQKDSL